MPLRCCTDLLYIGCEDTGEAILGGHSREAAGVVKLDLSFLLLIRRPSLLTSTGFSPGAVCSFLLFLHAIQLVRENRWNCSEQKEENREIQGICYHLLSIEFILMQRYCKTNMK